MAHSFGVKDAISGVVVDAPPLSYDRAVTLKRNIEHYVNTDYYVFELSADCSDDCAASHPGSPRPLETPAAEYARKIAAALKAKWHTDRVDVYPGGDAHRGRYVVKAPGRDRVVCLEANGDVTSEFRQRLAHISL